MASMDTEFAGARKKAAKRFVKKAFLFKMLTDNPKMSARDLKQQAESAGIKLSRTAAYRLMSSYKKDQNPENSEARAMQIVAKILQNTPENTHLSAKNIQLEALAVDSSLHRSTIYRILEKLSSAGLVITTKHGRNKLYEWKRSKCTHGHLSCISCGKTTEFALDNLLESAKQACRQADFQYSHFEFLLRSYCQDCTRLRDRQSADENHYNSSSD